MRLEAGGTIDALRNTRPSCLMCSRTEQYPQQELGGPEAQPRWKCPQRSGLLTWYKGPAPTLPLSRNRSPNPHPHPHPHPHSNPKP